MGELNDGRAPEPAGRPTDEKLLQRALIELAAAKAVIAGGHRAQRHIEMAEAAIREASPKCNWPDCGFDGNCVMGDVCCKTLLGNQAGSVDDLARNLVATIDNECEGVTAPGVWAAKEALEAGLRRLSHRAGDHGAAEHGIERSTKATFVPCDCGCGRSCCAHCGVDVGFVQETPSAPVAGSGEA
jgi:hypothetical protein